MRFFLFSFTFFLSLHVYALESETHYWYTHGYYTKSIHALRTELKTSNSPEKKSRLYYDIAYSYYAMLFVEDYKKQLDSANYFASEKPIFSIEDRVEYAIGLIRYYNYEIKPTESLAIYKKIYPEFHRSDPKRKSILWIKLYQNIATTRRNAGADYAQMNAEYDSAYYLIQKHQLQNTMFEVDYCKSRGNMNLDRVNPTSDKLYYEEAINYFNRGIAIVQKKKNVNYPVEIYFHSLKGLVSYMRRDIEYSKNSFDDAFNTIYKSKKHYYAKRDIESVYLNTISWGSFTVNEIYRNKQDVSILSKQVGKLKLAVNAYESFSNQNKDINISVFTDIYTYSPYNALVSCYYELYESSTNTKYLDSAFYFAEMNKTQWFPVHYSFSKLQKKINEILENNIVLVQYVEFGFRFDTRIVAIVKTKSKTFALNLGKKEDLQKWMRTSFNVNRRIFISDNHRLYLKIFHPLEKFIPSNTTKIIVTKSPFLEHVNFESLIVKPTSEIAKIPFLVKKYNILIQPSFRVYSESKVNDISNVFLVNPGYKIGEKSKIHFTGDVFKSWISKNNIEFNTEKYDLLLIAAHAYSEEHKVDNAYLDFGNKKRTIQNICNGKNTSKLVVLASCDGGIGQQISYGSSFSLASAFLFSGASSCVYSTSKLEDKIASQILADFLQRLKNGEPKDWALRNAKLAYLKHVTSEEGYNPIYWAGLQVMGDVSPVEIGKSYVIWYYIVGLTLLVGVGFVIKKWLRFRSA